MHLGHYVALAPFCAQRFISPSTVQTLYFERATNTYRIEYAKRPRFREAAQLLKFIARLVSLRLQVVELGSKAAVFWAIEQRFLPAILAGANQNLAGHEGKHNVGNGKRN